MRKIFTLLILLLLLPVTAVAQDDNHDNHEGWTALTNEVLSGNTLPAGKYYLSDDLECNGTPQTWITITDEVTLCLNGHVLNLNGQSLRVQSGATLHLCDCNTTTLHKFTVGSDGLWQLNEADGTETLTGGVITGGKNRKEDISSWNGGGVCVNGTFAMSGGNIVGNMSTNKGGGVYVDINGTFTLSGGSIAGNTCTYSGGGVFVNGNGTFTMSGGSIAGNTCSSGGGVYLYGTFTMSGGSIAGNRCSSGGGVYVNGTFTMSGGSITGNTCTYSGGGVYAYRTFTMSGAPIVTDNKERDDSNSNIYLYSSITIGEGGLTEGAKLGVTPDGSKTVVYSWNDEWGNPAVYFTSDNSDYGVGLDDQGNVVLVQKGSVTLDSNGGTIAEGKEVTSYTFGTSVPLPTADDITREGYTFGGWYDNEDFSGEKIEEISATDTGDKKYWAKWTANSYTVGFNANGGDGTMTNQSFTYDVVQALSANAFTRTGYTFTGWNTTADGTGTSYEDGTEVSNLSSAVGGEVTLYAQWTANSYTVGFNANGGAGTMTNQSFTYDVVQALSTNAFTRTGYTFTGWNTATDGTGTSYSDKQEVSNLSSAVGGEVTLYAQWTASSYTVTFDANGGDGTMTNQSFTYDVVQALSANAFTRTGYTFTGWNTAADGTGTSYSDKQEVSNLSSAVGGEVTLYAQWTASSYTVTLNTNGGTIAEGKEVTSYTFGTGATLPTEVTRTGYTFDGWYAKEDFSGDKVTVIPTDATGDKAYWAKWIANTYTITAQVASGCESMGEVTGGGMYEYGAPAILTATANSGYRFVKWEEDDETSATREITVKGDAIYTALFEAEPYVPDPEPDPAPISYYNIYVEDVCDGVEVTTSKNVVREGGSVSVYVEKDTARYTFDNFKVYYKRSYYGTWNELKEGTQPGEYPINNIWTHIYIKAEGAEVKEDPTGIESIEGVKVYTKDGSLYVQTPQREQVIIVSMSGAVVKNEEQVGLKQYHGLQPGIYIVRVGQTTYKLRLH